MPSLTRTQEKTVYLPNDEDGASIVIKHLKHGVRRKIKSLSNEVKAEGKDGDVVTTIEFNLEKKRELFYREVVKSWEGFKGVDGKSLKPTVQNILKFDDEIEDFYEWLVKESDEFNKEVDEAEEESKGN